MKSNAITRTVATNVATLISRLGITQRELGKISGMSEADVSKLLRAAKPDGDSDYNFATVTLAKFASALDTTVDALLGHPTLLFGTIAAGPNDSPITYDMPEIVTFGFPVPKDGYALRVSGHSCSRWGICHDDVIAVVPATEPRDGAFCVLRSSGGAHTLKAYSRGKWWQFRPTDSEPMEYEFDAATNMFGVVIGGRYGQREFVAAEPEKKTKKKGK